MRDGQRLTVLEAHPLFAHARAIIERLREGGHLTVLAGGCVRDGLLGVPPKDLDLATSAPPEAVEQAFERTLAVGKDFGTIVVVEGGHNFEVTTFRSEGPYLDGRHPSSVKFTDIEEDARRRDFTVNALFYDPLKGEVLDYVGGFEDLAKGSLRAVGVPSERFHEDKLRMLRAVRFVAQLGFKIEEKTMAAIQNQYQDIHKVSAERVFNEIKRLLESKFLFQGLQSLFESKLDTLIWPEITGLDVDLILPFPKFLNWENAFAALCWLAKVDDPEPRLRAWKASRDSVRRVHGQLQALKILADTSSTRAARARIFGGEVYAEIVVLAQGIFSEERLRRWVEEYLEVADEQGQLPKPLITGDDLLQMGMAPGEEMGRLIRQVFDAQLEARVRSRPEALNELKKLRTGPL